MQTQVRTPEELFSQPQRLLVPLFQRPYVWNLEKQWAPLWQDVVAVAERVVAGGNHTPHFLGAVVIKQQPSGLGTLATFDVIDGQQRLTTLQILMDSVAAVLTEREQLGLASRLDFLAKNSEAFATKPSDRFKVWPTNQDRPAFNDVVSAPIPVDYEALRSHGSLLVQAHAYFAEVAREWLDGRDGDEAAQALVTTITSGLQIVAITLNVDEDSQAIFETLNARGTPLTAADLIKNLVFQRLAAEGADIEEAYRERWKHFENRFWDEEVSVGRFPVSRSSLFFNQWLVSQVGDEIGPRSTYLRFKSFVEHDTDLSMSQILERVQAQSLAYRAWTETAAHDSAELDAITLARYRTDQSQIQLLKPIVMWLHDPDLAIPPGERDAAIGWVESWLMRRSLMRLSTGDLGRIVAQMIRTFRNSPPAHVGDAVAQLLSRLDTASSYWPADEEIRRYLSTVQAYRRFPRGRTRVYLQAYEDALRGYAGRRHALAESRVRRISSMPIEHLMPQSWRENWPVGNTAQADERDDHLHRLGNLTLLTKSLNSKVSNAAWLGAGGKREGIEANSVLLMNREVVERGRDVWDEESIDARTGEIIETLLATWRVPEGHTGAIRDQHKGLHSYVEIVDLVKDGLLEVGAELINPATGTLAEVAKGGKIRVGKDVFDSPSAAGRHVRGGATNGWTYWQTRDGRSLGDYRDACRALRASE